MRPALWIVIALLLTGCARTPPAGWVEGGRPTVVAPLRWVNGGFVVDVDPQGNVYENGELLLSLDRDGRVYDPDNDAVALLDDEGYVHGPNDKPLGWVGGYEAILPGGSHSWLVLHQGGYLYLHDGDGNATPMGLWLGCTDPGRIQTCMLISHVVGLSLRERARQRSRVSVGVGVGVGVFP